MKPKKKAKQKRRWIYLVLPLICFVIFLLTPGGFYWIYNAKDSYGDLDVVRQYLKSRGVVVVEDRISRRNLGTTPNCEATFKSDAGAFIKLVSAPDSKFVEDGLGFIGEKALKQTPEAHKQMALRNLLHLPPSLTDTESDELVRAFTVDNLLLYKDTGTLPTGWVYSRLLMTKTDGRAYLIMRAS